MNLEELRICAQELGYVIVKYDPYYHERPKVNTERKPRSSIIEKVPCPQCNHFASYKLDSNLVITYDESFEGWHQCAIQSCGAKFQSVVSA